MSLISYQNISNQGFPITFTPAPMAQYKVLDYTDDSTIEPEYYKSICERFSNHTEMKNIKASKLDSYQDLSFYQRYFGLHNQENICLNSDNRWTMTKGNTSNGKGICQFGNGAVKEGEWKDDRMIKGTSTFSDHYMYFPNSNFHIGYFTNGIPYGPGFARSIDGTVRKGIFADHRLIKGIHEAPDGTIEKGIFKGCHLWEGLTILPNGDRKAVSIVQNMLIHHDDFRPTAIAEYLPCPSVVPCPKVEE